MGLSATAAEFVPKKTAPPQQPQQQYGNSGQQQHHQHNRYRGDNNGTGGGGGGGGGTFNMVASHYPPLDATGANNGAIVNGGTDVGMGKPSGLNDRLRNLQLNQSGPQQKMGGHNNYSDNKDMRNSSHYNHHQQHPNQHYPQHSQQQRLQQHHLHQQQQHLPLHQNVGGPAYPFVGYSSTALNNHLHHPMLGGMATAVAHQASGSGGGGGGGMMPQHDNRNKNSNSFLRSRLHNAQNSHMQQSHHHQSSQHHHQQHHHQQQQHHNHHHQQQQHHGMLGGGSNDFGADADSDQISENETFALDYLTEVIAELYDNPGMFDSIQRKLKGTFAEFRNNHFVLSNAVEMIFEQSIKEQNFRYMGARLCKLLDSLDEDSAGVLRQLLSMKMNHQQSELLGYMGNEQIKVRGTTLFLAELYMQLRKPNDLNRNAEIAIRIIEAAKVLLGKEGPENIKCVCQCLKLCGFELERDRRDELMGILATLGKLEGSTDNSTGRFIRSVLDLQQKSWGRNEEVVPVIQPPMNETAAGAEEFNDSPVFYGPDGQVMTQEENDFLDSAAPVTFEEYDDEEGDPDDLVDDENMDLEIKLAFKEFVTGNNNNRQNY